MVVSSARRKAVDKLGTPIMLGLCLTWRTGRWRRCEWLNEYSNLNLYFIFFSGLAKNAESARYSIVVHFHSSSLRVTLVGMKQTRGGKQCFLLGQNNSTFIRDIVVKAIDLWCKRHTFLADDLESNTEEHAPDDPEDYGTERPELKPTKGPHPTFLCEMCKVMKRGCWIKRRYF